MGTLQNPSPNPYPYPNRTPLPNASSASSPNPNPNAAPGLKPPSFEEVSKLFSLPLSDAADSLGVCPSVLKKVCYDNGLVRWPYRKFLAGKSIDEIKKDVAIEKEKQLAKSKASGENDLLPSSAVSTSLAPQPQNTSTGSSQGTPASRVLTQVTQQPTRNYQAETFHNVHGANMNKGSTPTFDEFKYGFPSDGLLSVSYEWWGSKSASEDGVDSQQSSSRDAEERKQQPEDSVDAAANSSSTELTEGKVDETDKEPQWASALSALRKRAAEDGQQALRLGVYRGYTAKTLDRTKKTLLLQIFKSSLPSEWGDMSSES